MKKGISLPIEMIVIIAIVMLVLVVLAAFFLYQFPTFAAGITDNTAFSTGCRTMVSTYNCAVDPVTIIVPNYRPPGTTMDQTLAVACTRLQIPAASCRIQCGCPA